MKKKRFITFFKWLILGILITGALQISGGSFAAESGTSEAKVTTKRVMFDSLSQAEQTGIMMGRPNVTIQHDEETFQLVYKEKKVTPPIESTVDSSSTQNTETESSTSSSESTPTTPTVETTSSQNTETETTSSSESIPTTPTVESTSSQNTETETTSSSESIPTIPTVETTSSQNTETETTSSSESTPTAPTIESSSTQNTETETTSSSESTPTAPTIESSSTQNTETETTSSSESTPTTPTVESTSTQNTETESTSSSESIPTIPTVESTSTSDKEKESSTSSSESIPTAPTVESTRTQDTEEVPATSNSETTTTKPKGDKDGQDENQKLPKTGEENPNKGFILLGIVFLFAGGALLIWKGKQGKQLLLLIIIGGAGISVMSQATTLELPESTVETMAKGSNYQPDTEVEGYEYVGYIHSTADNEVPPIPEEKEGSVYVHYVNEAQEKIHDDLHLTGKVGDPYDVAAIQIPGMTFKETVGDPSGVFGELEKEVTFIYKNEKQIGRVQIDFKDITSFIGSYLDVQADENDSSSEIKVKAEGFFFLDTGYRIPNEGTLELSGEVNTPLVAPTELGLGARSHPLGVIYHDSEGREQTAVFTNMKAILSSAVPSVFTEEDQIIIFRMSVPN
jgi:LPXTG-motif cell wall-anchored protein